MANPSPDLLPCPFCGARAKIGRETLDERFAYADKVTVFCIKCSTSKSALGDTSKPGYADNSTVEARAVEQWNSRASLASRPAEVDEEGLPPLPPSEPDLVKRFGPPTYTAEQYRQGQLDAVAADRARRKKGGA